MMPPVGSLEEVEGTGKRRLRVLFVSNLFPDSVSTYLGLDNATLLHKLRDVFDVRVISPRPSLNPIAWLRSSSLGLKSREVDRVFKPFFIMVPYIPFFGTLFNHILMRMFLRRAMRGIVNGVGVDVVICSWLYPDGCAVATITRKLGVPLILITQGTDTHHYINFPIRKRIILNAINKSSAVISRSSELGSLLSRAGADPAKIFPVRNGVDESIFYPRDRHSCRKLLGISDEGKVIIFVGNLVPVKNPEFLIRAFADASSGGKAILAIIGQGPMKSRLEKLSLKLGIADRVIFAGPLAADYVAAWMGAADCLCLCSHNEGLPNVLIEALASGLPIIASDVGGISELLDCEERGVLVKPDDMRGYIDALKRIIGLDQSCISFSQDVSGFSWSECGRKHAEIIKYVLEGEEGGIYGDGKALEGVCSLLELEKKDTR